MNNNMIVPFGFVEEPNVEYNHYEKKTEVTMNGGLFSTLKDPDKSSKIDVQTEPTPKKTRKRKEISGTEIVDVQRDDNNSLVVDNYANTYQDTTGMLYGVIGQIDAMSMEVKKDIDEVRRSRTMRNKYTILNNMNDVMGTYLNAKVGAIKEINNSIKLINDMNYKKYKDIQAAESGNDDKYIMDMYSSFVQNPYGTNNQIAPNQRDMTMNNTGLQTVNIGASPLAGIVPANGSVQQNIGVGTPKPAVTLTPEQNFMLYENDPNIQMCVVYDQSTGNKWFQVMNIQTREPVPNMPAKDPMFLEDTTLDVRNGIAKNINLNESYPLIILNEDKFNNF